MWGALPWAALPALLSIDWRRLPDLPAQGPLHQGYQDSDGGVIGGDTLITAFGYSGGGVPGFLNGGFAMNTSESPPAWTRLPPSPVGGRQEVSATVLPDDSVVFVGGFAYDPPPYTYADVVRLRRDAARGWAWDTDLPPFPYPVQSAGVASVGWVIYAVGGCDYDRKAFFCSTNRSGGNVGMGSRLWSLDTAAAGPAWAELPRLPGPPRWVHSFTAVGGVLYVLGGAHTDASSGTRGLLDCWRFNPGSHVWTRLPDMPFSSSNWQTNGPHAFMDRYVILAGGNQYPSAELSNGSVVGAVGRAHQLCVDPSHPPAGERFTCWPCATGTTAQSYNSDVLVYDTARARWGVVNATSTRDPLLIPPSCVGLSLYPMNDNLPQTNVVTDDAALGKGRIFTVGGECDPRRVGGTTYTHYPTLALMGDITVNAAA